MAPSKTPKATATVKKEKVYHPSSRKAGQLARHAIRKGKLGNLAAKRGHKHDSLVDVYGFWYHALPDEGTLLLDELHQIIREVWLTRFDEEIESEKNGRRKGRPKSIKETRLEDQKSREAEEYRTGMEVVDLTHGPTVELFRRWDKKEVAFVHLLRFIRVVSSEPEVAIVSRPGKHISLLDIPTSHETSTDMEIVTENKSPSISDGVIQMPLHEPLSRFSSTMMTMDEPIST